MRHVGGRDQAHKTWRRVSGAGGWLGRRSGGAWVWGWFREAEIWEQSAGGEKPPGMSRSRERTRGEGAGGRDGNGGQIVWPWGGF